MNIKISNGNSKMGAIPSVSLPAGVTCRQDCECSMITNVADALAPFFSGDKQYFGEWG